MKKFLILLILISMFFIGCDCGDCNDNSSKHKPKNITPYFVEHCLDGWKVFHRLHSTVYKLDDAGRPIKCD